MTPGFNRAAAGDTYSLLIAHNHLRNRAINIATKATNAIAGKNSFSSSIFVAPKWLVCRLSGCHPTYCRGSQFPRIGSPNFYPRKIDEPRAHQGSY